MVRKRGINKTRWLLTIDSFSKSSMKKSIFNIELVHQPMFGESQGEDNADSSGLDDRAKSPRIVYPRLLRKATKDPSCFIALKPAI